MPTKRPRPDPAHLLWSKIIPFSHLLEIALHPLFRNAFLQLEAYLYSLWNRMLYSSLSVSFGDSVPVPFGSIHHAFVYHANEFPDAVALVHLDSSLTYRKLHQLSNGLAKRLQMLGISRGSRVCLLVHRSIPMVVGIFAVLKAGASYIPLDGGIVTDKALDTIISDSRPALILYSKKFSARMASRHVSTLELEEFLKSNHSTTKDEDAPSPITTATSSDEAYVIYTSGTTGSPKGVSVSHKNVTNLVCTSPGDLGIRPGTRVAQLLNISFDMCAWEILGCLSNGGTLVLRGSLSEDWHATLKSVDVIISTPSILLKFDPSDYPNIRTIATAGERCPQQLADRWAEGRRFLNCCGPTEVTIINSFHLHVPGIPITIGMPTPNNSIYVLDGELRPVPLGAQGILWAGGAGISNGYVNLPDLTNCKFKPDPFSPKRSVMYNTGDLGRMRIDGQFDHLGRIDDQVKIKGFRVELDGVAAAISRCSGITSAVALHVQDILWGIYSPCDVNEAEVQKVVASYLPYYAAPSRYLALESMPLTSNGKVDKGKIRAVLEQMPL